MVEKEDDTMSLNAQEPNKNTTGLDFKFDQLIGHDAIKEFTQLYFDYRYNHYEKYIKHLESTDSRASKGILFNGLPGTGKSTMMHLIGNCLKKCKDIHVHEVKRHTFMSGNVGAASKKISDMFDKFRQDEEKLTVVCFDEIDVLVGMRGHNGVLNNERVSEFITQIDGMYDNKKIIIVGTTNFYDRIDDAIQDRFNILQFDTPNEEERTLLFIKFFKDIPFDKPISHEVISTYTKGFTGRSFRSISENLNAKACSKGYVTLIDLTNEILNYNKSRTKGSE